MADSKLEIIITAKDNASGPLGKIGSALGGMAQIAGGFIVANLFGKIADSVTGFFSDSLSEARESIAVHKQLEQVIKSTGGVAGITAEEADKLATSLSQVTNFTDDTILSAQNMLLTFTNVGEKVFPRATETILDMSQALGQDTKSSAIQLGKALNDPIKGITALSRVGVTFTQQQKDMIKAMVEAGDIAGAQGVILDELAKEFGGSAKALADPAILLQNAWANAKEEVGMAVIPVLNKLSQIALPMISNAIQFVIPFVEQFGVWMLALVEYITFVVEEGDILNDWLTDLPDAFRPVILFIGNTIVALQAFASWFMTDGIAAIQPFVANILSQLVPGLQLLWTWFMQLASIVLPLLQQAIQFVIDNFNIFGPILAVVGGLILALTFPIGAIIAVVTLLATAWANNWGGIQEKTQAVLDFLAPYWEQLKTILNQFTVELLPVLQQAWIELQGVWESSIQPALAELWTSLQELFVAITMGTGETDYLKGAMERLKTILDIVILAVQVITPLIRFIGEALSFSIGMTKSMIGALSSLVDGLRGVSSAISSVISKISDMASSLSSLSLPSWLESNSPTPFEIGLRGIGDAIRSLPELQSTFNVSGGGALAAAGPLGFGGAGAGSSPVVVNVTYSPVVSTADKFTLEKVLTEVVNDINRKRLSG